MRRKIGCHLSSASGFLAMGKTAVQIDATTFQFFTRNPRGGKAKAEDPEDVRRYLEFASGHDIGIVVAHAPYTMNLCSADPQIREFGRNMMKEDLERLEALPGTLYNFHPGSHVRQGEETGICLIAEGLNQVLRPEQSTTVLLETMAGKGSEIGKSFEQLREILDRVELSGKMGVCLDTCHVWDGGYDIAGRLEQVLEKFDRVIGLDRLKAVHLNDSLNRLGARKDRHAVIGGGCIGKEALIRVFCHPVLKELPFCLETPNDLAGYAAEIRMLREAAGE